MDQNTITPELIAKHLLKIGAVTLNVQRPFLYSSGLVGPIYCDNRLILSFPETRDLIVEAFKQQFSLSNQGETIIAGIATGGIAYAALLADKLNLPMVYIRSSAKAHGKQQAVEGKMESGDQIVLIEDLITTGNSALKAAQAALDNGAVIHSCYSIFSYNLQIAINNFADKTIEPKPLCTLDCLLEVAKQQGDLSESDYQSLKDWQQDPKAWSEQHSA
jgi:orotate phosphoribosyltransferase